jgi:hypothetical protein
MEEFAEAVLKMDIFFFVSTVLAVAIGLLLGIALYYLIRTLRSIMRTAERVEEEVRGIADDVASVRGYVRKKTIGAKEQVEAGLGLVGGYAKAFAKLGLEQVVASVMKRMGNSGTVKRAAGARRRAAKRADGEEV